MLTEARSESLPDLPNHHLAALVETLEVELDLALKVGDSTSLPATAEKPREGPSLSSRVEVPLWVDALGFTAAGARVRVVQ